MGRLIWIPAIISLLRIAFLPLFLYIYTPSAVLPCLVVLAASAATDFLDGYAARKFKVASRFGAYFDATTDFALMLGIYTGFFFAGYFSVWLLLLIAVAFAQFLVTSLYAKRLYDPVGKYLGSALYIGVVLTLLFPTPAVFLFVQFAFAGFLAASLVSRAVSLMKKGKGQNSN